MLNSMSHLTGAKLTATDGDIGTVKDFFRRPRVGDPLFGRGHR